MSDFYDECLKLSDVTGRKVDDIIGYVSNEFGHPTFKVVAVKFADGTYESCGGEHDFPYVECEVPERFHEKDES